MRKGNGKETLLCHSGHVVMENRSGLILAAEGDAADGQAERRAAKRLLAHVRKRHRVTPKTTGLDAELESDLGVVPHVPIRKGKIVAFLVPPGDADVVHKIHPDGSAPTLGLVGEAKGG